MCMISNMISCIQLSHLCTSVICSKFFYFYFLWNVPRFPYLQYSFCVSLVVEAPSEIYDISYFCCVSQVLVCFRGIPPACIISLLQLVCHYCYLRVCSRSFWSLCCAKFLSAVGLSLAIHIYRYLLVFNYPNLCLLISFSTSGKTLMISLSLCLTLLVCLCI